MQYQKIPIINSLKEAIYSELDLLHEEKNMLIVNKTFFYKPTQTYLEKHDIFLKMRNETRTILLTK